MTRARDLRAFLSREGFAITDECVRLAAGKLYFCLAASYTGEPYMLSRLEEELGQCNLRRTPPEKEFLELLVQKIKTAEKRVKGLRMGGMRACEEEEYLTSLKKLLNAYKG